MASLTIIPGGPSRNDLRPRGQIHHASRCHAERATDGETTITGHCRGEDCLHTAQAFREMGVTIDERPTELRVIGKGFWGLTEPERPIDCGNSGTGIRLLTGLLAGQDFFTILTGDDSVRRRPWGAWSSPCARWEA
jgi:3-phosphoshikimate 1-carboxyvinyltransferase